MKIGDVYKTKNYGDLSVTHVENCKNVYVEFIQTGFKTKSTKVHIKNGEVRDLMYPKVHGVGYVGSGIYNSSHPAYNAWYNMLTRCYSKSYQERYPTYVGVYVAKEWHNFQSFAKWYVYEVDQLAKGYVYHLDKDLTRQGFYSKDTCCLLPQRLNNLFVYRDRVRGKYLIGVSFIKATGEFRSSASWEGSTKNLGHFKTETSAYDAYKAYKESLIKNEARKAYKCNLISEKTYNRMLQYRITKDL